MSKKNNVPKGVRNEFEDIDYWHKLPKNKFVTLKDGTKINIYEYMKKFMHEAYGNSFSRDNPKSNILQTEDQKKWARRNNNNTNRDAFLVSKKIGELNAIFEIEKTEFYGEAEAWEETFKYGTYENALGEAIKMCCTELEIDFNDTNIKKILRSYFRVTKFVKLVRRDKQLGIKK